MSERINKRIISLLAAALVLTACTQDELPGGGEELSGDPRPLVISSVGIAGEHTNTKVHDFDLAGNHVSTWDGGDIISVKIGDGNPGLYDIDGSGRVNVQKAAYWQSRKDNHIVAWYPKEAMNEGATIDLSKQSTEGLAYVLKADAIMDYTPQRIDLYFKHQLAKVRVKLEKKDYEGDFSDAIVTLHDVPTSVVIENGEVNAGSDKGNIQLYKAKYINSVHNEETFYEANLAPGTNCNPSRFKWGRTRMKR